MPRRGVTLIELLVAAAIVAVLAGLTTAGVQKARAAAQRAACGNNARQLALATHSSAARSGTLPPGTSHRYGRYPFASWITQLLDDLGEPARARVRDEDYANRKAFFGPNPHRSLAEPLVVVLCPAGSTMVVEPEPGHRAAVTYYLGVSGDRDGADDGMLYYGYPVALKEIRDGTSNTLLFGERPPDANGHFGWWYAGVGTGLDGAADHHLAARALNRTFRAPDCPFGPYGYTAGDSGDPCSSFHFYSEHPGGAHFAFADGSVRFLRYSAASVMPSLATRAGRESAPAID